MCGHYTDPSKECTCTAMQIQKYMADILIPLMDRIDLHIKVPAVKYRELSSREDGESSAMIRDRAKNARQIQADRFAGRRRLFKNADM
jgi:magnesium chelatase family protein